MPLTLLAQRAAATIEYPGGLRAHADCHRLCGAGRRGRNVLPAGQYSAPSGWRAKSCPEKRPAFQGKARDLLAIALHRRLLRCGLFDGGSKLGRAHRSRLKHMTQFQAEGRDPLRDNLPSFLSSGRLRTPAVGVLLLVFIGKGRFKGAMMGGASATTSEAVNASCGRWVKKSS